MQDINDFYNSILNIGSVNNKQVIEKIVKEEKDKLKEEVFSLDGFCKYIASQIEERLKDTGIKSYFVDLNELVGVDHVVLISEYKENNEIRKILIDPTFEQFVKKEGKQLLHLDEWPSEKLDDSSFVNELLSSGVVCVDNEAFNKYINAFSTKGLNIDLDSYILSKRLDSVSNKRV